MAAATQEEKCSSLLVEISVQTLRFFFYLYSLTSHPLFSIITTSYVLTLLYLPRHLLSLLLSPVPISTLILLTTLLHFGSAQTKATPVTETRKEAEPEEASCPTRAESETDTKSVHLGFFESETPFFSEPFVEWSRPGPLEVIYEELEWEEKGGRGGSPEHSMSPAYGSLGLVFTDSDTGSDSGEESPFAAGWDSTENVSFRWEEEEDEEGEENLIEIPLEENLIEIDISVCR